MRLPENVASVGLAADHTQACQTLGSTPSGLVDFDRRWSWDVLGGFGAASTKGSEEPFSI